MTRILVDSSVWIDYLNGGNPRANVVSDLIDHNVVCTNDLILAELIPSIIKSGETELVGLLKAITKIKLTIDWENIIEMQVANYKKGLNKIGIPDLIILQNTIQNNLSLFSFDKHFRAMSAHHKFKCFEVR